MSTRRQLACSAGLLVVLGVLYAIAGHDTPPRWEHDVVDAMTHIPRVLGAPMEAVMQLGARGLVPVLAVVAWAITRRWPAGLEVLVAGLVTGWGIDRLKDWSGRPRPVGVHIRDHVGGPGFPSGHTATACAVAVVFALWLPSRWRAVPLALAAIVGLARMYVGAHYPLDVLGGAAWGAAVALAVSAAGRGFARPGCSAGSGSSHP